MGVVVVSLLSQSLPRVASLHVDVWPRTSPFFFSNQHLVKTSIMQRSNQSSPCASPKHALEGRDGHLVFSLDDDRRSTRKPP